MIFCCALSDEEILTRNDRIEKLIAKLANNGISAMDELYELIRTDVYAYALSKSGNPHDAADLTQDTFVQIYKYAKAYEPQGKPLSWIFTIVANMANRLHIVNGRSTSLDEEVDDVDDGTEFERDVINQEFMKQILKILKPEEQEVIVLHIVSGLKHNEIAKLLNQPLSTILSRYNRAIKKLQRSLKEEA